MIAWIVRRLLVCGALLLFFSVALFGEETPQEVITELLAQERCDCLEVAEIAIDGGTHKTVLVFRKIGNGIQEIRLQVVSPGADHGYAYYSKIDAQAKEHLRDIMWVYRPQDGKVRRYNSILHEFLDTGIPPYLVDRAGWWKFYRWAFLGAGLHGTPFEDFSFLPEVIIAWGKEEGIPYVTSLELVARGNVFLSATFSEPWRVNSKIRTKKIVVGPPSGPFTMITLSSLRFEKLDEEWASQIFHPERLPERRTPDLTRQGEILAKIDFSKCK